MNGTRDLADAITACADEVTRQVVADIYKDPFWEARFGARGRRYTDEDGRYHLSYLAQALLAGPEGDPGVLSHYAMWLRSVLVSRGMCSRHLAENFERLAAALREKSFAGIDRAVDFLQQAAAALRYGEGPAALLQRYDDDIIERATAATLRHSDDWTSPSPEQPLHAWCRSELGYYLSYLADALAASRPEIFTKHLQWSSTFLARTDRPEQSPSSKAAKPPSVIVLLDALEAAIVSLAQPEISTNTDPLFSAARSGLK